jgi:hypothetical protein
MFWMKDSWKGSYRRISSFHTCSKIGRIRIWRIRLWRLFLLFVFVASQVSNVFREARVTRWFCEKKIALKVAKALMSKLVHNFNFEKVSKKLRVLLYVFFINKTCPKYAYTRQRGENSPNLVTLPVHLCSKKTFSYGYWSADNERERKNKGWVFRYWRCLELGTLTTFSERDISLRQGCQMVCF